MGGQTALNVALQLYDEGTLARHGVELIGVNARAIRMVEDRSEFAQAMDRSQRADAPAAAGRAAPPGRLRQGREKRSRRPQASSLEGPPGTIRDQRDGAPPRQAGLPLFVRRGSIRL
jgi:carbamoylphosphate synthase large subunit